MRAGRLLETRGDKDGAIERYKIALDANPKDTSASTALRKAYAHRGDWLSAIGLVERELTHAEGDLAKARLHAELAKIYHSQLVDPDKAEAAAKKAIALDSSSADALMVLGDLAFEANRLIEATKYYESLVGRTGVLPKEDAVRVLVRFIEAFGKTQPKPSAPSGGAIGDGPPSSRMMAAAPSGPSSQGRISVAPPSLGSMPPPPITNPRMLAAVDALQSLAPQDVDALARAANALFEFGDPHSAYRMHKDLFEKYGVGPRRLRSRRGALSPRRERAPLRRARGGDRSRSARPRTSTRRTRVRSARSRRSTTRRGLRGWHACCRDRGASPAPAARHRAGALRAAPRDRRRHVPRR